MKAVRVGAFDLGAVIAPQLGLIMQTPRGIGLLEPLIFGAVRLALVVELVILSLNPVVADDLLGLVRKLGIEETDDAHRVFGLHADADALP